MSNNNREQLLSGRNPRRLKVLSAYSVANRLSRVKVSSLSSSPIDTRRRRLSVCEPISGAARGRPKPARLAALGIPIAGLTLAACDTSKTTESDNTAKQSCAGVAAEADVEVPPWPDDRAPPATLDAAVDALNEWLPEARRRRYRCLGPAAVTDAHFGLGLWVGNNWSLYSRTPLTDRLESMGLDNADDMSELIVERYLRALHGRQGNASR